MLVNYEDSSSEENEEPIEKELIRDGDAKSSK